MDVDQGMAGRPLRGAMLGTGSIAVHHMLAWQAIPDAEIVALANRTRERAVGLGHQFGIAEDHIYADYRDLLAREALDFVDIATAPTVHPEQVLAAAAQGVHVFCQKPFATSTREALVMIEACEAAGVRCIVNENWRWRRWYRELKRLLDDGRIGQPHYARFVSHGPDVLPTPTGRLPALLARQPYTASMPRLILYEWGIHLIDVMRFLFGDIDRVYARMSRVSPLVQGEDLAVVLVEFATGVTGVIDISWGSYGPDDRRAVRGSLDPFVVEGAIGTVELDPYPGDVVTLTTASGMESWLAHPNMSPAEAYQESYFNTHAHFVYALRTGQPAENDARDNLKTFAATMGAYESARTGTPVSARTVM